MKLQNTLDQGIQSMNGPFTWLPDYCLGIESIDSQHQVFFSIINQLYACPSSQEIEGILERMDAHVKEHFRDEEDYMRDIGFPALRQHQREHAALLEKYESYRADVPGDPDKFSSFLVFLAEWVVDHIIIHDMQIQYFTRKKNRPVYFASGRDPIGSGTH